MNRRSPSQGVAFPECSLVLNPVPVWLAETHSQLTGCCWEKGKDLPQGMHSARWHWPCWPGSSVLCPARGCRPSQSILPTGGEQSCCLGRGEKVCMVPPVGQAPHCPCFSHRLATSSLRLVPLSVLALTRGPLAAPASVLNSWGPPSRF